MATLQKVKPGQDIVISASDWNAFIDAAIANKFGGNFGPGNGAVNLPLYKCQSTTEALLYGVAVIPDSTMPPATFQTVVADNPVKLSYMNYVAMPIKLAQSNTGFNPIGIVQSDAVNIGSEEEASYSGVSVRFEGIMPVRFDADLITANHTHCYAGDDGLMIPATVGAHRIICILSEDTDATECDWALVHINSGLRNTISAQITASTAYGATGRRWSYEWVEVRANGAGGWETVPDGMTNTNWALAYNGLEASNTAGATTQSSSYDFGADPLQDSSFDLRPIRGTPVVQMYLEINATSGNKYATFQAQNIVDGTC